MASPIVLATATVVVASQRPEYSHARQTLSELGTVGRTGAVWMNAAGIIPAGLLVALSAIALGGAFGRGRFARAGATALAAAGACFAGAGLFPWVGGPGDYVTRSSQLHLLSALLGFFLLGLAPLLLGLHARREPAVRQWFVPSIAAAVGVWAFAFSPAQAAYPGAYQRAALVSFYTWLIAASLWAGSRSAG